MASPISCGDCANYSAELDDLKTMLVNMEGNHAEVVKELKRKYEEEVATMQTLLNEAAAEAASLTRRSFEQERTKLIENSNEMESEIQRLRQLVVDTARQKPESLNTNASVSSAANTQMFEDEIEMLKIQLATANQEIAKVTIEKEKTSRESVASTSEDKPDSLSTKEAEHLYQRLSDTESKNKQLLAKLNRAESEVTTLRSSVTDSFDKAKLELNRLREKFQSVVEINRRITFYYAKKSREMREEDINLPASFDELLSTALNLREQVILERANREVIKEKTSQEIELLRSELQAEQNERQQMEQLLSNEIDSLHQDLAKERAAHNNNKTLRTSSSLGANDLEQKSHSDSNEESLKQLNAALEAEANDLRQQVARLQVELDTSESVQQDLVRLSQSLQVSLEGLRDQSEVRWEFDDEVDQCRSCKKTLPVAQRKVHCRHCGKIFCDTCLAQSVPSGAAKRPAHVCSQCHFLLVQEAKPYFTEASES